MADIVNRYSSVDLFMPQDTHTIIKEFHGPGDRPFPRLIDAWWLGLCIGVHEGEREPFASGDARVKFMAGDILSSDPWRVTHLELLALSLDGPELLQNPSKVIQLAMEYANYGLRWL